MKLEEWAMQAGAYVGEKDGRKFVHDTIPLATHRSQLWWALSDYKVETVQAGVIWLMPRQCPPFCHDHNLHKEK